MERIGHRGAPRRALENTAESFGIAFDQGADAVELDVHVSADGIPVVHHDGELSGRVRPETCRRVELSRLSAAHLRDVDLGDGLRIPTLRDVLGSAGRRGFIYVEVKAGAEEPVARVIRESEARCAVHSFDHAAVRRMAAIAPEIPRGILFDAYPENVVRSMNAAQARDVWPKWRIVDADLVRAVHGNGGRVIVWTVNDRATLLTMRDLGVDGICTDDLTLFDTVDP
jgi:glycerophosphoryl diester phosphodiesterase